MAKYHISKNGDPKPCRAKVFKCPLGGISGNENHFDTLEEAKDYLDMKNEVEFGLIRGVSSSEYVSTKQKLNEYAGDIGSMEYVPSSRERMNKMFGEETHSKEIQYEYLEDTRKRDKQRLNEYAGDIGSMEYVPSDRERTAEVMKKVRNKLNDGK